MARVFIVHGWGGNPEEAWFPWLKEQLEAKKIETHVLAMPDSEHPKIENWVPYLAQQVKIPDRQTYFVGHSMGVQTILRYIEMMDLPVGGLVAVAGFYTLQEATYETDADRLIAKPWLETPINNKIIRRNCGSITAIFSDTDPFVGLDNVDLFKNNLGAKTIILHGKGHMGANDNIKELPEVLSAVEEMIKK